MPPRPDQQRLTVEERSNLVAYLDGELNETDSRSIANLLTRSPTARHEIEALQKTWEMLDFLSRPQVPDQFSERTVTEIRRLEEVAPAWHPSVGVWASVASRFLVTSLVAILSLGIGYAGTRWLMPDPTARLTQELSLAEHLDEYLQVGSFEFLSKLADSPEFNADHR